MSTVAKYSGLPQDEKAVPLNGVQIPPKEEPQTSWWSTGLAVATGITVGTLIFPLGGQVVGGYIGYRLTSGNNKK